MLLLCESFGSFASTAALAGRGWNNDDDSKITLDVGAGPHGGNAIKMVDADATPTQRTGIDRPLLDNCDGASGIMRVAFSYKNDGFAGNTPETGGEALIMLRGPAEDTGLFGADAPSWSINMSSSGTLQIEDATDNTANFRDAVATGGIAINDGNWHDIEVYFLADDGSSGEVKTWVDGVLDIDVSGIQTAKTGFADISAYTICDVSMGRAVLTTGQTCRFGHILVWDDRAGGLTGELPTHRVRIDARRATGDAGPNLWAVAPAGTASSAVSEGTYDGDGSYIQSGVKYAQDLHSYAPLGFTPAEDILGVVMVAQAKMPLGSTQDIRMVMVEGMDVAFGDDFALDAGYKCNEQFFTESPSGAAWTESSIDSTKFGVAPGDGT